MLHKDLNNNLHDDMNGTALHLLPAGCVPITDEEAAILLAPPPPTPEQLLKAIEQAIEKHMDTVAQSKRYDNRDSCRLYAGYVNPFQTEAIAFGQWVSDCWVASNEAQALIMQGLMQIPTPEEAVASLPKHPWYVAPVVPEEPPVTPPEEPLP